MRARCEREPELLRLGSGFVLYALTDAVVDRYFPVLDLLEAELESVEERIFANNGSPRANIEALYDLKNRLDDFGAGKRDDGARCSATMANRLPTMIAGIYGMNFEHMPELGWKYGYGGAVGVMAVIDVYVFYRLRKAKWL